MAEDNTRVEYNHGENSDCEGYKNEDIGENESIVPHSYPDSSDIEVLSAGSSEVSNDHSDFGDEWDDNGPNTLNAATVTANATIPNWTTNFTDITIDPFTQDSGPCLPENFDVSVATTLDYFNLLFKPEIFSNIRDHTKQLCHLQTRRNSEKQKQS